MYGVLSTVQANTTVGIVDVGADPTDVADMNYYRSYFGLPTCTGQSGCFTEYAQNNGNVPVATQGWTDEITLDLETVSAVCPSCHITLIDAYNAQSSFVYGAVQSLAGLGVHFISMSFASNETPADSGDAQYFSQPDTVYAAGSGDNGYNNGGIYCGGEPVCDPAAAPEVIAVGGVRTTETTNYWYLSAWKGSGSGCAIYTSEPAAQTSAIGNICNGGRAVADVSALADPNTGAANYSSSQGWYIEGGTSLATPIVTSLIAISGNDSNPYAFYANNNSNQSLAFDVTSGTTIGCDGTILCTAGDGWDGPTGIGTPNTPELFGTSPPAPLALTPVSGATGTAEQGTPMSGSAFTPSGGSGQYRWSATGLPAGVTIRPATGTWAGSPGRAGSYTVTITLTDAEDIYSTVDATYTLRVPLSLSTASGSRAFLIAFNNYPVHMAPAIARGSTSGLTWSATGLPDGLNLNSTTGVLSGSPTRIGDSHVDLSATNTANHTASISIDFRIVNTYGCSARLSARIHQYVTDDCGQYWSTAPNNGGTWRRLPGHQTYTAKRLPAGLSLNRTTGRIKGRPLRIGKGLFTVVDNIRPDGVLISIPAQIDMPVHYTIRA
jgi:hypothetical protein